jgi:hypothetical protein
MLTACKTVGNFILRVSKDCWVDWDIGRSGKHGKNHFDVTMGVFHNELSDWA